MKIIKKFWLKICTNAFIRVITGVFVIVTVLLVTQNCISWLLGRSALRIDIREFISAAISAIAVICAYRYFFIASEKRKIMEFGTRHFFRDIFAGMLIGGLLQTLAVAVIYFNGGYRVIAVNELVGMLPWMGLSLSAAVSEEIIFRGIIFRIIWLKPNSFQASSMA